ncbi:methylisocitrate lyase [soil metagenome]
MLNPPLSHPGERLRELWSRRPVVIPGVYDGISAVSAHKAGAEALYLTGAGLTNAGLGVPDIALATLTEFASAAARVTAVVPLPVLSDADTGFGTEPSVRRTVIEMERAGLAGIHLEDQQMPKRCGHLDGKTLISTEEMAAKIRTAVAAKADSSFVIVARTDARGVEGLDGAISRAQTYVAAGADAVFPEGLASEEEFSAFRASVAAPLLANMTEFGKTPLIPASRFGELGYEMVIFPMTAFRVVLRALDETYAELLGAGGQAGLIGLMRTRAELYELIDYSQYDRLVG